MMGSSFFLFSMSAGSRVSSGSTLTLAWSTAKEIDKPPTMPYGYTVGGATLYDLKTLWPQLVKAVKCMARSSSQLIRRKLLGWS